ncbi:Phenylacetaldoxime dehydratase [Paramyrothecium foliicola]|nr:Phenylacetaldoxime dehydratase [Paramyrothecium foliicola]
MSCPVRKYPLRKPEGHEPPVPKWSLTFPEGTSHIYTTYVGVQRRSKGEAATDTRAKAVGEIEAWLSKNGNLASEFFIMEDGGDKEETLVWVCYWLDEKPYLESNQSLNLPGIFSGLPQQSRASIGMWRESFITPLPRLETNYGGIDYLPGLGRISGTSTVEHNLSTYWGAARDRISSSAYDLFEQDPAAIVYPASPPDGLGQHLVGTNYNNLVHIRSGQFWETCSPEEALAYEQDLEPTLIEGMRYLWENPRDTGAMAVRYLRNQDEVSSSKPRKKETCGASFFNSMDNMEEWAKTHPSHLAIWNGAMNHYKKFKEKRLMRTWHEVSVLQEGDASFEYVNCSSRTGVIPTIPLEVRQTWA